MQTLVRPIVKLKISSFDNSAYQEKVKSNNLRFGLDIKFYQNLFPIFLTLFTFLIFPETPQSSEVLCKKYHSTEVCNVW